MNIVILSGRLTRDPELRNTQGGKAVANFGLAVDRGARNEDGSSNADFFEIVVWDKQAENCAQYLIKGQKVTVNGRMQNRSWTDDNGNTRHKTEIVANPFGGVEFGEKPRGADGGNGTGGGQGQQQTSQGGGWGSPPAQQQQSGWGNPPAGQQQQQSGWGNPPAGQQQQQGGWGGQQQVASGGYDEDIPF